MEMNTKLKQLRNKRGISQEEAAQFIGVSLSSYQKYEREKNSITPSIDVILRLADFYNVTTDYLLGREQGEPSAVEKLAGEFNMTALEKEILEGYVKLPKEMRGDLMEFLHKAVANVMNESRQGTVTCGELEDRQKAEAEAKDSAG